MSLPRTPAGLLELDGSDSGLRRSPKRPERGSNLDATDLCESHVLLSFQRPCALRGGAATTPEARRRSIALQRGPASARERRSFLKRRRAHLEDRAVERVRRHVQRRAVERARRRAAPRPGRAAGAPRSARGRRPPPAAPAGAPARRRRRSANSSISSGSSRCTWRRSKRSSAGGRGLLAVVARGERPRHARAWPRRGSAPGRTARRAAARSRPASPRPGPASACRTSPRAARRRPRSCRATSTSSARRRCPGRIGIVRIDCGSTP